LVVAIPLRGYVVCNLIEEEWTITPDVLQSQSPYGAKWFATVS